MTADVLAVAPPLGVSVSAPMLSPKEHDAPKTPVGRSPRPSAVQSMSMPRTVKLESDGGTCELSSQRLEKAISKTSHNTEKAFLGSQAEQRLLHHLAERGGGSSLRGWRRELDPDGSLDVNFPEFCRAATKMGFVGDAQELFGLDEDAARLTLKEITPELGGLLENFRLWISKEFGGHAGFFTAFDTRNTGHITKEQFVELCPTHGFEIPEWGLEELFGCCDVDEQGTISKDEVVFLETDKKTRELEIYKCKSRGKDEYQKLLAWVYNDEARRNYPATHRLAARPWLARSFEQLPAIVRQRKEARHRIHKERSLEARISFLRHLRDTFGNEVRAWRRGLDPNGIFEVSEATIRKYCRQVDFKGDVDALWKSLDKAGDGAFRLEELCVHAADALASFQAWAFKAYGSCLALWDCPEIAAGRKTRQPTAASTASASQSQSQASSAGGLAAGGGAAWVSNKKMLLSSWAETLRAVGCPVIVGPIGETNLKFLFQALDLYGCGFIARSDLEWLDAWKPSEWLCVEPDPAAWEELRVLLVKRFSHLLRAWRVCLDQDNSNRVSWTEFRQACKRLKFPGNIGGAWRALDDKLSGWISLAEVDANSAQLLNSFKEWAETNFGSVQRAFKALDTDGGGTLTYSELRRACQKLKWQGEVRLLFDCLDTDGKRTGQGTDQGKRSISYKEIAFLDTWEVDMNDGEAREFDLIQQALGDPVGPTTGRGFRRLRKKAGRALRVSSPTAERATPPCRSASSPSLARQEVPEGCRAPRGSIVNANNANNAPLLSQQDCCQQQQRPPRSRGAPSRGLAGQAAVRAPSAPAAPEGCRAPRIGGPQQQQSVLQPLLTELSATAPAGSLMLGSASAQTGSLPSFGVPVNESERLHRLFHCMSMKPSGRDDPKSCGVLTTQHSGGAGGGLGKMHPPSSSSLPWLAKIDKLTQQQQEGQQHSAAKGGLSDQRAASPGLGLGPRPGGPRPLHERPGHRHQSQPGKRRDPSALSGAHCGDGIITTDAVSGAYMPSSDVLMAAGAEAVAEVAA